MHCCIHYNDYNDYTSLLVKFYSWIISFIRPWKSAFLLRYILPGLWHESQIRLLVVPGQCYVLTTAYSQLDCICKRAIIKDESSVIMPSKCNREKIAEWIIFLFTYCITITKIAREADAEPCMATLSADGKPWEQIFSTNRPFK